MLKTSLLTVFAITAALSASSQAENEIQVYASPTIQHKWTIFELHSNYTFNGPKGLANPKQARWVNETLEITHGIGKNAELGVYTFTGKNPLGKYEYLATK